MSVLRDYEVWSIAKLNVEFKSSGYAVTVTLALDYPCMEIEYLTTTTALLHHVGGIELDTPC